jgi:hypothetical protein
MCPVRHQNQRTNSPKTPHFCVELHQIQRGSSPKPTQFRPTSPKPTQVKRLNFTKTNAHRHQNKRYLGRTSPKPTQTKSMTRKDDLAQRPSTTKLARVFHGRQRGAMRNQCLWSGTVVFRIQEHGAVLTNPTSMESSALDLVKLGTAHGITTPHQEEIAASFQKSTLFTRMLQQPILGDVCPHA